MADRFYLTAQVNLIAPKNLNDVVRRIKERFNTVTRIETKIVAPANLGNIARRIKDTLKSSAQTRVKISINPSNLSSVKNRIRDAISRLGNINTRLVMSPSIRTSLANLQSRLRNIGVIRVRLALPPNFRSVLAMLQQLNHSISWNVRIHGNQGINATARDANRAKDSITDFANQSNYAIRRYAAFTIVAANFFSLFNAVKSGISDAIDFEKELIKIRQVTGTSLKDLQGLTDTVTNLSTSLGVSSKKLLNVSQIFAQAGYSAEDTKIALDTLAKTELSATFENMENTTEAAIAAMAQFKINVKDLKSELSSINSVAAKFAVESSDINSAIRRTGGAFQAAGGNLKELTALFTSVRATTRESAESIATGFRTIFTRLQRIRTQDFLGNLGIELKYTREEAERLGDVDLEGQFVGPYKAIERIGKALNKIRSTDPRAAQVYEELGGFRQISKVIPLIAQEDKRRQALNVAKRSSNSLDEDAIKAQDGLSNKLTKLKESFDALIRRITSSDSFKQITDLMLNMAKVAIKLTDALTPLLPLITVFSAAKFTPIAKSFTSTFLGYGNDNGGVNGLGAGLAASTLTNIHRPNFSVRQARRFIRNNPLTTAGVGGLIIPSLIDTAASSTGFGETHIGDAIAKILSPTAVLGLIGTSLSETSGDFARRNNIRERRELRPVLTNSLFQHRSFQTRAHKAFNAGNNVLGQHYQDEANRFATQHYETRQRIQQLKNNNVALVRNTELLTRMSIAVGGAVGVLNYFSEYKDKQSRVSLDKGDYANAKQQIVTGSTVSSAGIGGAVGVGILTLAQALGYAFAPQVAIAITALTALTGSIIGFGIGVSKANEEIESRKLQLGVQSTGKTLSNIVNNKVDVSSKIFEIDSASNKYNSLLNENDGKKYETLKGELGNITTDLETFVNRVAVNSATKSGNLDGDFSKFNNSVQNSIVLLSKLTSVPVFELNKQFKEQISEQKKFLNTSIKLDAAKEKEIQRTTSISSLMSSLNDLSVSFELFSNKLDSFDDDITGKIGAGKYKFATSIYDNLYTEDQKQFKDTTTSIGGFLGPRGLNLANEIDSIPKIVKDLPNILLKLQEQDTFEEEGLFTDRFEREFSEYPKFLVESMVNEIRTLIGREAKPDKLLSDIRTDRFAISKQITKVFDPLIEVFKHGGEKIESSLNLLEESFAKVRQKTASMFEHVNKIVSLRSNEEQTIAGFEGRPVNTERLFRDLELKRKNILGKDADLVNNPQGMFQRRDNLKKEADSLLERINSGKGKKEDFTNRQDLLERIDRLDKSLNELTDVSEELAIAEIQLNQAYKKAEVLQGIGKTAAFGSTEEKKNLGVSLAGVSLLAQDPKNINKIPQNLRGDMLNLLESFGTSKVFGKQANKIIEDVTTENLTKGFLSAGLFKGKDAEKQAKELATKVATGKTNPVVAAENRIKELYAKSINTNIEFVNKFREQKEELIGELEKVLSKFIINLQTTPVQADITREKNVKNAIESKVKQQDEDSKKLTNLLGGRAKDIVFPSFFENLGPLRNNLGNFEKQEDITNKQLGLYSSSLPTHDNDYTNEGLNRYKTKLSASPLSEFFSNDELNNIAEQTHKELYYNSIKFRQPLSEETQGKLLPDIYKKFRDEKYNEYDVEKKKVEDELINNDMEVYVGTKYRKRYFDLPKVDNLELNKTNLDKYRKDLMDTGLSHVLNVREVDDVANKVFSGMRDFRKIFPTPQENNPVYNDRLNKVYTDAVAKYEEKYRGKHIITTQLFNKKRLNDIKKVLGGNTFKDIDSYSQFEKENKDLKTQLEDQNKKISGLEKELSDITGKQPQHNAFGGFVHGGGKGDIIKSWVSPGEFILKRKAVEKLGVGNIANLSYGNMPNSNSNSNSDIQTHIQQMENDIQRLESILSPSKGLNNFSKVKNGNMLGVLRNNIDTIQNQTNIIAKSKELGNISLPLHTGDYTQLGAENYRKMLGSSDISKHFSSEELDKIAQDTTSQLRYKSILFRKQLSNEDQNKILPDIFNKYKISKYSQYDNSIAKDTSKLSAAGIYNTKMFSPDRVENLRKILSSDTFKGQESFNEVESILSKSKSKVRGNDNQGISLKNSDKSNVDITKFNDAIQKFSTSATDLVKALNAFPHEVKLTATHNINVTLNGAEAIKNMMPTLQTLVINTTTQKINELLTSRFPNIPLMQNT